MINKLSENIISEVYIRIVLKYYTIAKILNYSLLGHRAVHIYILLLVELSELLIVYDCMLQTRKETDYYNIYTLKDQS